MLLPGQTSTVVSPPNIRIRNEPLVRGPAIVIDSGVTDAGSTPNWRIRPGIVVVKKTATGRYVLASDATGDRCLPASVSSTGTGDAGWNNATVTIQLDGGVSFSVTLGAGTATAAAAVTDLNNNAAFAANCIADVSNTFVRIRTKRAGAGIYLAVSSSAATFVGAGVTLSGAGSDADYRVVEDFVDLQDSTSGAAINAIAPNSEVGFYALATIQALNANNLTIEAQAVLARRGSLFG